MMSSKKSFSSHIIGLAVLLLVMFAVAIVDLDTQSFWYDEGWTAWTVYDESPISFTESLSASLSRIHQLDVHPPLYYLLLDTWTMMFGETEFMLRLPSVFYGLLALAATYLLGKRLLNPRAALIAVAILGTHGFLIYYTREARMYTLFLTLATLSSWAYLRWLEHPSRTRTLVYGIFIALSLSTHYLTVLVLTLHGVYTMFILLLKGIGRFKYIVGSDLRIRLDYDSSQRHTIHTNIRWFQLPLPYLVALALFLPWLPYGYEVIETFLM